VANPIPLGPVERQFFAVHGKEILAKEFSQFGEKASEPADHRIVTPDRIAGLGTVDNEQSKDNQHPDADHTDKSQRQDQKNIRCNFHAYIPICLTWRDMRQI
jgi:hypothetical protein